MEFIVLAVVGYFIFKFFKSSKDQKEYKQIIDSVPNFQKQRKSIEKRRRDVNIEKERNFTF